MTHNAGKAVPGEMIERLGLEDGDAEGPLEKRKVIKVKAINAKDLLNDIMTDAEVADNVWFKRHPNRPFVFWLMEVK